MKINSIYSIPFQKKHVANCQIKNDGKDEKCKIFELEKEKDMHYFLPLFRNKDWRDYCYIDMAGNELKKLEEESSFYTLESQRGKCLGYCKIDSIDKDTDSLELIEALPISAYRSQNRKRHYIGETILAFALLISKRKNKSCFIITNPVADAIDFYTKKCGFYRDENNSYLHLNINESDKFIRQNQKHTHGKIIIVD